MLKIIAVCFLALMTFGLQALPEFGPLTTVAEDFCSVGCPNCLDAAAGLDSLHNRFHPGEFISLRHYQQAGNLSNQWSEALASSYGVSLYPTVIFNGTATIYGGGDEIENGSVYLNQFYSKRYATSPVKIEFTFYNASQSTLAGRITMLSPTFVLNGQTLRILLVENNPVPDANHVVREIITQTISLTGLNNYADFSAFFTTIPANPANFWAAAYIQMDDHTIIQAASTLPQPNIQLRAAFPFSTAIIDSAGINYNSQPIWFYNTGQAATFTLRLLEDSAPNDWYFNYCSEDGMCYPGFAPHNFSLEPGQSEGYHLNLIVGSSGTASFHFIVEAAGMEPYIIPFTYQTSDTPNQDNTAPQPGAVLLSNYPNPFHAGTTFKLQTAVCTPSAQLDIYNSRGRKVYSLQTGTLKAGVNEIVWQGTDKQGRRLPSGVYYYRLSNETNQKSEKLLLLNN